MQQSPDVLDFTDLESHAVQNLLQTYQINLSVDEAQKIQNNLLKRPPTIAECVLWSIQGSEHCSYKSTRQHLKKFNTSAPHVILGPKEDAGIVSVAEDKQGMRYGIVISHESHNHPSQIVPYEGAATGVGGNVRDVCCMGAEVIAVADGLRFGDLKQPRTHWIYDGVVSGIAGYGNPLGIANLAGDVYFNAGYNSNCLVTVVTLGVVQEDHVIHSYAPKHADDYVYILVGKPTDNSGFGGAAFASHTLREEQKEKNKGAVQEPNAFLQRHILKANYALFAWLRENNLINQVGFKDLGAGGIACASLELAEASGYGAEIKLDDVNVSQSDLSPAVVLCAETQERFMWVVPPHLVDTILKHYNETYALPQISEGACATVIGHIRTDGQYVVTHQDHIIVNAKAHDITQGIVYDRPFVLPNVTGDEPNIAQPSDFNHMLLHMLSHENVASRLPIYEKYDKQVQGRTVLERGSADAGIMSPFNEEKYPEEIRQTGIALALAHNPRYNQINAYWGAVNAVLEAVRQVVAVGCTPLALSDCLCFGNPEQPEQMGLFVESIRGIVDACAAITLQNTPTFSLPIISGNVSLYNDTETGSIPPSPMMSCLGAMPDVAYATTSALKKPGATLFMVGARRDECGGSLYYECHETLGACMPQPDLSQISNEIHAVTDAIQAGLVLAAHDIAMGGVAVALAEMSFANELGVTVTIPGELTLDKILFSETGGFLLEVASQHAIAINKIFNKHNVTLHELGHVTEKPQLRINEVIDLPVSMLKKTWLNGLRDKLV